MNEWLDDRDGSVGGGGVTPCFEIMNAGNHPFKICGVGRFIQRCSEVHDLSDLGKRLGEFQIRRCVVDRIDVEDDECLDLAGVHVLDKGGEGLNACFGSGRKTV